MRKLHRENPVFITGMGLQCAFQNFVVGLKGFIYSKVFVKINIRVSLHFNCIGVLVLCKCGFFMKLINIHLSMNVS